MDSCPPFFLTGVMAMFEWINSYLDKLYFGVVEPLFLFISEILNLIFIKPFTVLHLPLWLHISFLAVITACLSFYLRKVFKVEEKLSEFNEIFTEKQRRQQDLQLIPEKYSRQALYKVTDDELNEDYNTYLAHHYVRYVLIYLLPILLIMAWLNSVFSEEFLIQHQGTPYILTVPANRYGIEGVTLTVVFLLAYIFSLIIGFRLRRKKLAKQVGSI